MAFGPNALDAAGFLKTTDKSRCPESVVDERASSIG